MFRLTEKQARLFATKKHGANDTPITLQIRAAGLPDPEPEFEFAAKIGRKWAADLAWPEWKILFEQEGSAFGNVIHCAPGSWRTVPGKKGQPPRKVTESEWTTVRLGGRHNTGAGAQADCEKYSWAAILGYTVIRATTTMIRDGIAITLLEAAFREKGFHASQSSRVAATK